MVANYEYDPRKHFRIYGLMSTPPVDAARAPLGVDSRTALEVSLTKAPYRFPNTAYPAESEMDPNYNGRPTLTTHYDTDQLTLVGGQVVDWPADAKIWDCEWSYVLDSSKLTAQVVKRLHWYRNDGTRAEDHQDTKDIGYTIADIGDRISQGVLRRRNCYKQLKADIFNAVMIHHALILQDMTPDMVAAAVTTFGAQFASQASVFEDINPIVMVDGAPWSAYAVDVQALLDGAHESWLDDPMYYPPDNKIGSILAGQSAPTPMAMGVGDFVVASLNMQALT